jgi:pimeloyl-ACP methyl ester carboxylesterase
MSTPEPGDVVEQVVRFGPEGRLHGVLSSPAASSGGGAGATERTGVLLLNAGLVPRVGPNRMYVRLARSLARAGRPVLRFDFSGVGDSDARRDTVRFEQGAVEETRLAMDLLADREGCTRFATLGLCSGAEIAFKAACADERVVGAAMINAPRYLEEPAPELVARLERVQAARYYWGVALFKPKNWLRVLGGRAQFGAMLSAFLHKLGGMSGRSGGNERTDDPDVAAFDALLARDVHLALIFSEGDWGWDYLAAILGKRFDQWQKDGPPLVVEVPRGDHLLTPLSARRTAMEAVEDWTATLP